MICLCLLVLAGGCRKQAPQIDPEGPGKLIAQLRLVHKQQRYKELDSMVDPSQLTTLVRTLMAVDRLLTVSAQIQEAAEQHVGPTAAEMCDMSVLADYLGPFSRNVHVVSTRVDGDKAVVCYQVGERVPVQRAQMRWQAGRWVFMPDDADETLPDVLLEITDRLVALKAEVLKGTYDEPAFIEAYAAQVQQPLAAHLEQTEQASKAKERQSAGNSGQ